MACGTIADVPRPLSDRERAVLDLLLSADFPGVETLREQALLVNASNEGTLTVGLIVEGNSRAQVHDRTPVRADVDGDGYHGGLLLFVDQGQMSKLQYWWDTKIAPPTFPPLSAIGRPIPT